MDNHYYILPTLEYVTLSWTYLNIFQDVSSLKDETTQEKSSNKDLIAPSAFLEDKIQTVEANDISTADSDITENLGNDESKSEVDTSLDVTNESVSSLDKELNEKGKLKIKRCRSKIFTIFHMDYLL